MLNNATQSSRFHAEKAIADLESYSHILKNMEKKISVAEQDKLRLAEELKEVKERYVKLLSSN